MGGWRGWPFGRVLRLGAPILVTQLGMIVTGFADTMMVGRYSTEALASASFTNTVFNTAIFACLGMAYGVTPLVGALYARKSHVGIGALLRKAMAVNLVFCLIVCAAMAVVYLQLHHLGQPPELLPVIRPYFLIYLAGLPAIAAFNVLAQWSYAVNNTSMPMWVILGANAVNVLLNWLLIYGPGPFPELGLTGAGWATFAARWGSLAAIVAIFFLARANRPYAMGWLHGQRPGATVGKITATSLPIAAQMSFEAASFSISGVMTGWLGAIALAAFQVVMVISTLGFCVYYSMSAAVAVLVSNAAGHDDNGEMRRAAGAGYVIILGLAALASVVFALWGKPLLAIFSDDPAVVALAVTLIFPMILYQGADATQITFAGALRGTSHVMPMLWIALVSYILVQTPLTHVAAFTLGLGVRGIIFSFFVSLMLAGLLYLYFFLRRTRHTDAG